MIKRNFLLEEEEDMDIIMRRPPLLRLQIAIGPDIPINPLPKDIIILTIAILATIIATTTTDSHPLTFLLSK